MAKLYGPAPTAVYKATALTNNSGFNATTFMSKWESVKGAMLYRPTALTTVALSNNTTEVRVSLDRGGGVLEIRTIFSYATGSYNDEGAVWGFASEPQSGDFTFTQETRTLSKQVAKLYGPITVQERTYAGTIREATPTCVSAFNSATFTDNATIKSSSREFTVLTASHDYEVGYDLSATDTDSQTISLVYHGSSNDMAAFGVTVNGSSENTAHIDLTSTSQTVYKTKKITKLYGAVSDGNGGYETKLIYEDI